ncbi:uncharacterized protein LOC143143484 isoform X2 [Ptiloglossa arizonensis]|uniref:uncharacterized protein LOC143143484 isoform X2 n=1 Tax=Ptiloglossa arizonensis TaxID=3350558 RepID=UPI003FA01BAF
MYRESASRSWSSNHEIYLFDTRKVVSQALRERSNNGGRQQELELCIYFARSRSELERGDGYRLETNTRRIRSFPIFQTFQKDVLAIVEREFDARNSDRKLLAEERVHW